MDESEKQTNSKQSFFIEGNDESEIDEDALKMAKRIRFALSDDGTNAIYVNKDGMIRICQI